MVKKIILILGCLLVSFGLMGFALAAQSDSLTLKVTVTSGYPNETEPNNDFATANIIQSDSPTNGTINPPGDQDYFKITTLKKGILSISLTKVPDNIYACIYLFDSNQDYIGSSYSGGNGDDVNLQQELTSPGDYYILVFDWNNNSSTSPYRLEVGLFSFGFYSVYAYPDYFSPNADGGQDTTTIHASITAFSNWTINIKDSSNVIKRTFTGTDSSISQIWDGKDSPGGNIVPDGTYTYFIDATDPDTQTAAPQVSGKIIVDNTPPTTSITEPVSGAKLSGTVAIRGVADDLNYSYGYLYYGQGTSPTEWNYINYIYQVGPDPGLLAEWDTATTSNGNYTLRLEVYDQAGNVKRVDLLVKLYNMNIYNAYVYPGCFSPNNDGIYDSTSISANITGTATWTIEIKDSQGNIKRTFTGTDSSISQIWDGKDSPGGNIVPDGTYTYFIDATDPDTQTAAPQVSGQVTVDNTKPIVLISQPTNNHEISGIFDIKGLAKDFNYNGYNYQCFLAYGEGINPTSWKVVKWLYEPIIEDPNGNPSLIYQWDTTKLPNGHYTLHLSVMDTAGNLSEVKIVVNLYNVGVIEHSVNPRYFSPNGDGKVDTTTIVATLTMSANWTINVKDKNNTLIQTFSGTSNTISQSWDGKNSSSQTASDGNYTYTIDTIDPAAPHTPGAQVSGNITLDTIKPTALISQPHPGELISGAQEIKGLAKDLNYNGSNYQCYLAYGKGASPASWEWGVVRWLYEPILEDSDGNPGLIYSWDTSSLEKGLYTLRLLATDAAENISEVLMPVHICKVNNFYAEPVLFSPNGDGVKDTTNIVAVFDRLANWTISIKNSSGVAVRSFSGQGSSIIQVWDGKNISEVIQPDGVYSFNINATDAATGQNILTGSGEIKIDNTPPTVNITQPSANSKVTETVVIKGIASDLNYDGTNSTLSWGQGTSPTQWNILANITSAVSQETELAYWYTTTLKNGPYTLRLLVSDLAGNVKDTRVPVEVYNVRILDYSDAPDPFTPDNDGDKDTNTITANLSMNLYWEITITDKDSSNIICQFNGSGDTISQVWNGENTSGQVVTDDVYNYKIEATDLTTSALPAQGTITADTALPTAVITSPIEGATVGSIVAIMGTASDNNIANYKVEYGEGSAPSGWDLIYAVDNTSVTNDLLANWDSVKVGNGIYTLRLTVTDAAGHTAVAQVKVTVDNIKITAISVNPDFINPHNSETATINYRVDRDANITIKIYDLENDLIRTLLNAVSRSLGAHSEIWNGKDNSGNIVPDGTYTLTIEAQAGSARGWYQSMGGFMHNAVIASDFNITQNFNPYNNELCRIDYTLPQNALLLVQAGQHEVWTYATVVNWEVRAKGSYTEYWDGRDKNGDILDYYTESYPLVVGYQTKSLPENSVVVTGAEQSSIDVLSDPYTFMPAFGEFTNISFTILLSGNVSVSICKPSGELVKTLLDNISKPAGIYTLTWDGKNSAAKVVNKDDNYIIKVDFTGADGKTITRYGNITTR